MFLLYLPSKHRHMVPESGFSLRNMFIWTAGLGFNAVLIDLLFYFETCSNYCGCHIYGAPQPDYYQMCFGL